MWMQVSLDMNISVAALQFETQSNITSAKQHKIFLCGFP